MLNTIGTYFRFIPKMNEGRNFFKNELKVAIEKEDWPVITNFFEEYVTKVSFDDLRSSITSTCYSATSNYFYKQ